MELADCEAEHVTHTIPFNDWYNRRNLHSCMWGMLPHSVKDVSHLLLIYG